MLGTSQADSSSLYEYMGDPWSETNVGSSISANVFDQQVDETWRNDVCELMKCGTDGNPLKEEDGCVAYADCISQGGSFSCICKNGYQGNGFTNCTQITCQQDGITFLVC